MAEITPQKRVLPARARRESTAKRRATSPQPATPVTKSSASNTVSESKPRGPRGPYNKRPSIVHTATPTRSASTPTSNADEILPTRLTNAVPLPTSLDKQQSEILSNKEYQSIADSAILFASLHRSRMQWLCDGVFKKYWTKPIKRKGGVIEQPPNNPDVKSMQKLGNATITIEPHTFEATFYVVRDPQVVPPPVYKPPSQPLAKHNPQSPTVHSPIVSTVPATLPPAASKPVHAASATPAPLSSRPSTPPGGAKTTDPVIQMLASRAATDSHLKDLMKVVATSRASPEQLKEFQAHIDEFNAIVKRQELERERQAKLAASTPLQSQAAAHPTSYSSVPRNSPLNPGPQFATYSAQPRPEPMIKHVVLEFTSLMSARGAANTDRWLFPENAVLDMKYGGTEMTCSFLLERKGADVAAVIKDPTNEEMRGMASKWDASAEYYQPVTMVIKATQHRTIETIARSAKPLPVVQKYMREVMEKKTRAPQEYLVYRLPRDKPATRDFVDSAVELSGGEDDELKEFYPM